MSTNQREGGASKSGDTLNENSTEHDQLLFKCRMAENSERFDDMVTYIKAACEKSAEAQKAQSGPRGPTVGPNERNFLSVAYKNSVGSRRNALRCLQVMKTKYEARGGHKNVEIINEYYKTIHDEMHKICREVLELIDKVIIPPEAMKDLPDELATREFRVFFYKMYADYYRYLAEFTDASESREGFTKEKAIEQASSNYQRALDVAREGPENVTLPPSHPIRLGLCLNYSVFLYEIQEKPQEAKTLAKQAFDDALDNLDNTGELEYKDSTLILQLLRDNTTLWSSQDNEGNNAAPSPTGGQAEGGVEIK